MTDQKDDFRNLAVYCAACGDPAATIYKGKPCCRECYLELAQGVISARPARSYRPGRTERGGGRPQDRV